MANVCVASEPCTYDQAINCEDRQAIDEEFDAHCKNTTWEVIDRPPNLPEAELVDPIWVFKIKRDSKNNIKGYNARPCI